MASRPYKNFRLLRISSTPDNTFGVLFCDDIPFCLTLERGWHNNQRSVSCIPEGFYLCERTQSPKFGDTFKVKNVPNRSLILFHKGNLKDDTHGCILVGEQYEPLGGENAILASGKAFTEFKEKTKSINAFLLQIESHK